MESYTGDKKAKHLAKIVLLQRFEFFHQNLRKLPSPADVIVVKELRLVKYRTDPNDYVLKNMMRELNERITERGSHEQYKRKTKHKNVLFALSESQK